MSKTAIEAKRANMYMVSPFQLTIIGYDTEDGPEHPQWDPRIAKLRGPLDPQMVQSIERFGLIVPIKAVKDGDRVLVAMGRRRTVHARAAAEALAAAGTIANRDEFLVPVIMEKGDAATIFMKARIENRFREDEGPLTTAYAVQHLRNMGAATEDICVALRCADQTVYNAEKLLGAHPDVLKAVEAEQLTPTAAVALTELPRADQVQVLSEIVQELKESGDAKPTVATVKRAVAKRTGRPGSVPPKEKLERIGTIVAGLAGMTAKERTREALLLAIHKITKLATGSSWEKLTEMETDNA